MSPVGTHRSWHRSWRRSWRRFWFVSVPEFVLALPSHRLTPRFSIAGSLWLLVAYLILGIAAASYSFVSSVRSDLTQHATERLNRIDKLVGVVTEDLKVVGNLLAHDDICDDWTLETLTRASLNNVVISRLHWLKSAGAQSCAPYQTIGDPISYVLTKIAELPDSQQPTTNFQLTPTFAADLLVIRRLDPSGHLAGQIPGSLLRDFLAVKGTDNLARVQLRRQDGRILHDTTLGRNPQRLPTEKYSKRIIDASAHSISSTTFPLAVRVWVSPRPLLTRALTYLLAGVSLAAILTAFTIAQINLSLQQRWSVERRLRIAVRKRQFEPVIQPIISGRNGRCVGGEILMRWQHPARGLLSPLEFLSIAEKTNLIDEMTSQIMTKARDRLSATLKTDPDLHFSFNVTVRQIRHPEFIAWLERIFDEYSLPTSHIVIELVERDAVDARTREALDELRRKGYRIAIDDFGTGQSSLALISGISFDTLKIDREFVRAIDEESVNRPVLNAIIELTKQLGVYSIAEGVETAAQYQFLVDQRVHAIQGYLIAKPMPISEFSGWLKANHQCPFKLPTPAGTEQITEDSDPVTPFAPESGRKPVDLKQ